MAIRGKKRITVDGARPVVMLVLGTFGMTGAIVVALTGGQFSWPLAAVSFGLMTGNLPEVVLRGISSRNGGDNSPKPPVS